MSDELGAAQDPAPGPTRVAPTRGDVDELLAEPPDVGQEGGLHGYRSGRRMRVVLLSSLVLGLASALFGVFWLTRALEDRPPEYHSQGSEALSEAQRSLHWTTEGPARLGLMRKPPGVLTIVLPDRIVRLADDAEHAQVKVIIEGGETRAVTTLVGRVVVEPRTTEPRPAAR